MKCHAGYGWVDANFDFKNPDNVDCLVCHEGTNAYVKGVGGIPTKETDLVAAARSVGTPAPRELPGLPRLRRRRPGGEARRPRLLAGAPLRGGGRPHRPPPLPLRRLPPGAGPPDPGARLLGERGGLARRGLHRLPRQAGAPGRAAQRHLAAVACQTCHIPNYAGKLPTKATWDWSKAGDKNRQGGPAPLPQDQGRVQLRAGRAAAVPLVQRHGGALPAGRQDRSRSR